MQIEACFFVKFNLIVENHGFTLYLKPAKIRQFYMFTFGSISFFPSALVCLILLVSNYCIPISEELVSRNVLSACV